MAGLVVVVVIEGLAGAVADVVRAAVAGLAAPVLVVAAVLVVVVVVAVVLVIADLVVEAGFSSGSFFAGRLDGNGRGIGADAGLGAVAGAKRAVASFFVGVATGLEVLVSLRSLAGLKVAVFAAVVPSLTDGSGLVAAGLAAALEAAV